VREVVTLALAGLPGVVLQRVGTQDVDVVVSSTPRPDAQAKSLLLISEAGGLGQLLDTIRGLLSNVA
jgi:hypothetical protein